MEDEPRMELEDFFAEATARHLANALKWSGQELVEKPEMAKIITDLLKGDPELTKIVLGISAVSRIPPPQIFNTITTGFAIGVALVLECLNDREEFLRVKYNDTVQ